MRRKSHPRLGAVSSLLSVEPKALALFGVSVCNSIGVSVFKSMFHFTTFGGSLFKNCGSNFIQMMSNLS